MLLSLRRFRQVAAPVIGETEQIRVLPVFRQRFIRVDIAGFHELVDRGPVAGKSEIEHPDLHIRLIQNRKRHQSRRNLPQRAAQNHRVCELLQFSRRRGTRGKLSPHHLTAFRISQFRPEETVNHHHRIALRPLKAECLLRRVAEKHPVIRRRRLVRTDRRRRATEEQRRSQCSERKKQSE